MSSRPIENLIQSKKKKIENKPEEKAVKKHVGIHKAATKPVETEPRKSTGFDLFFIFF